MFLSDFADAAVTMPLAALILVTLRLAGAPGAAGGWALAACGTFAVVLAGKVLFGFVPPLAAAIGITSPSGHTACATIVYAALARVLGAGRVATALVAIAVAVAIAATRVALGDHTPPEAALGAAIGLAGVAATLRLVPAPALVRPGPRGALAAGSLLCVIVLHGHRAPFERLLLEWRAEAHDVTPA